MGTGKSRRRALLLAGGLIATAVSGLLIGRISSREPRWEQLDLEALRRAARAQPNNAGLFLALGRRLRQTGDLRGAAAMARRAYDLSDGSPRFVAAKVGALVDAGDLSAAQALAAGALVRSPASGALRAQTARIYLEQGQFAQALAEAREAVRLAPDQPEAWQALGIACSMNKRPEEAFAAFAKARELGPRDAELLADHAEALGRYGRTTEAEAALAEARAQAPRAARPIALLGVLKARRARTPPDRDEARRLLQQALERAPSATDTIYHLALLEMKDSRLTEAGRLLQSCLASDPTYGEAHLALGQAFQRMGRTDAARQAFDDWRRYSDYRRRAAHLELRLRRQPDDPELLRRLTRLHADHGNQALAERYQSRLKATGAGATNSSMTHNSSRP